MTRPVVLCFSGHDPSGGAGIQADSEAIVSLQGHCCSIITALTAQDTRNVTAVYPQSPEAIIQQAEILLADVSVKAVKIGLIADSKIVSAIVQILKQLPGIPVVLDPVLAAGGGSELANQALIAVINEQLLPLITLITPNSPEARRLTGLQNLADCAQALQGKGADYVLITGSHESTEQVHNQLFMPEQLEQTFTWERLPHSYHGSGCTLASAIAALLAQGLDMFTACNEAQDYTWQALQQAYQPGKGQYHPQRFFWAEQ